MDARPQSGRKRRPDLKQKEYVVIYPFAFEREGAEKFLYFLIYDRDKLCIGTEERY